MYVSVWTCNTDLRDGGVTTHFPHDHCCFSVMSTSNSNNKHMFGFFLHLVVFFFITLQQRSHGQDFSFLWGVSAWKKLLVWPLAKCLKIYWTDGLEIHETKDIDDLLFIALS